MIEKITIKIIDEGEEEDDKKDEQGDKKEEDEKGRRREWRREGFYRWCEIIKFEMKKKWRENIEKGRGRGERWTTTNERDGRKGRNK